MTGKRPNLFNLEPAKSCPPNFLCRRAEPPPAAAHCNNAASRQRWNLGDRSPQRLGAGFRERHGVASKFTGQRSLAVGQPF